jgi:hypothetical protein
MLLKRISRRVSVALVMTCIAGFGVQAYERPDPLTLAQQTASPAPSTPGTRSQVPATPPQAPATPSQAPVVPTPSAPTTTSPTAPAGSSGASNQFSVPAVPDAQPICPSTTPLSPDSLVLINRIETLVANALDQKIAAAQKTQATGTVGKGLEGFGRVSVDRADLDEIRADVEQIKVLLQTYIAK